MTFLDIFIPNTARFFRPRGTNNLAPALTRVARYSEFEKRPSIT